MNLILNDTDSTKKLWEVNNSHYYNDIYESIKEAVQPLNSYKKFLNENLNHLDEDSKVQVTNKINPDIESIIGFFVKENKLPSLKGHDVTLEEADFKTTLFRHVYDRLLKIKTAIRKLQPSDNGLTRGEILNLVEEFNLISIDVLKQTIFPERELREKTNKYEQKRQSLAKSNGIAYEARSAESNHISQFHASWRGNPTDYRNALAAAFDSILESIKLLKADVAAINNTELSENSKKELLAVNEAIKNLRPFLKGTKAILRQAGIGEADELTPEFSESEKILAADFIINYLYDELFDRLSDVQQVVQSLVREFDLENNQVLAKLFVKNEQNIEKNLEATRNVWGQHSAAAQNAVLLAKAGNQAKPA